MRHAGPDQNACGQHRRGHYGDGIHRDHRQYGDGSCYEGLEGAAIYLYSGTYAIYAADDAVNAANGDLTNYSYSVEIGGGVLEVCSSGGDGQWPGGPQQPDGGSQRQRLYLHPSTSGSGNDTPSLTIGETAAVSAPVCTALRMDLD